MGRQDLGTMDREEFTQVITDIRDQHPCALKGQSSDREATGERHVGLASEWFRGIPNIRVIDIDHLVYCPACWAPLVWVEEKTTEYNPDEWQYMRYLARKFECHAMFFLEKEGTARVWIYPGKDHHE
jgi:hypothetical protein